MANVKLSVTVSGGSAPFSIKASLYKGSKFILGLTSPESFDHEFKDLDGDHTIMVSGPNPLGPDGRTTISLSTDNITLKTDSDANPATRTGNAFLVQYHFITLP